MVGKIKHIRQKLHHGAVKLNPSEEKVSIQSTHVTLKSSQTCEVTTHTTDNNAKVFSFPTGVFAGTQISPEALVQSLKIEEASHGTSTRLPAGEQKGERKQQSKKSKMKERRERWLSKISTIKQEREKQVAQARRKATPIVGDMRPLADALPELSQLLPLLKPSAGVQRKNKTLVKRKPEPTNFSSMKEAQKRKLLETEASHFSEVIKNLAFKTNPFAAIGEHLRKRLKQEDEQN